MVHLFCLLHDTLWRVYGFDTSKTVFLQGIFSENVNSKNYVFCFLQVNGHFQKKMKNLRNTEEVFCMYICSNSNVHFHNF